MQIKLAISLKDFDFMIYAFFNYTGKPNIKSASPTTITG